MKHNQELEVFFRVCNWFPVPSSPFRSTSSSVWVQFWFQSPYLSQNRSLANSRNHFRLSWLTPLHTERKGFKNEPIQWPYGRLGSGFFPTVSSGLFFRVLYRAFYFLPNFLREGRNQRMAMVRVLCCRVCASVSGVNFFEAYSFNNGSSYYFSTDTILFHVRQSCTLLVLHSQRSRPRSSILHNDVAKMW